MSAPSVGAGRPAATVEFAHVTKRYEAASSGPGAVNDLSFAVPAGKICVLVGPSGCGKTTSLKMVNRLIEPSGGRILVDGVDIATRDVTELRRGIGYVIQQVGLFPHLTIGDNVAVVPRLLGWPAARQHARADELLALVGLDPAAYRKRYPAQLSGGERQRVGVARALAADPPLMLMDEPFGAVDPIVRERLQNEFLRLQHDLAKTILFVTHDIDEAIKMGDLVAVMQAGRRARPVRAAGGAAGATRPRISWPASWAPTGASRACRSMRVRDVPLRPAVTARPGEPAAAGRGRGSSPTPSPTCCWWMRRAIPSAGSDQRAICPRRAPWTRRMRSRCRRSSEPETTLKDALSMLLDGGGPGRHRGGRTRPCRGPAHRGRHRRLYPPEGERGWDGEGADDRLGAGSPATSTSSPSAPCSTSTWPPSRWSSASSSRSGWPCGACAVGSSTGRCWRLAGILYTIPSLALFAALIPITGLTLVTAEVPLVLYTLLIYVRNIVAGFDSVPRRGAGGGRRAWAMPPRSACWRVELPLAVPLIVAGLRIASVSTIGLVTITGTLGDHFGGLGFFIFEGYTPQLPDRDPGRRRSSRSCLALAVDFVFVAYSAG